VGSWKNTSLKRQAMNTRMPSISITSSRNSCGFATSAMIQAVVLVLLGSCTSISMLQVCGAFSAIPLTAPFGQRRSVHVLGSSSSSCLWSVQPADTERLTNVIADEEDSYESMPKAETSAGMGFGKDTKEKPQQSSSPEAIAPPAAELKPSSPNQMTVTKSEVERCKLEISQLSPTECKDKLLKILGDMEGTKEEWLQLETIINALEDGYTPMLTLDFFNMALEGQWRFMFSTSNTLKSPPWGTVRVREMTQVVTPGGLGTPRTVEVEPAQEDNSVNEEQATTPLPNENAAKVPIGKVTNEILWDLANEGNGDFDCTGKFSVDCSYEINKGKIHEAILAIPNTYCRL
jgi:hypothetical protein